VVRNFAARFIAMAGRLEKALTHLSHSRISLKISDEFKYQNTRFHCLYTKQTSSHYTVCVAILNYNIQIKGLLLLDVT
jgi:hypothetical protein